jgi:kynurenine formamidase
MSDLKWQLQFAGQVMTLVDLSAPLDERTTVYPGDPPFRFAWHTRWAEHGCNVGRLDTTPHAGTHVDAPLHFLEHGSAIGSLPLSAFIGPGVAFDVPKAAGTDIVAGDVPASDIRAGDIVLFRTGWDKWVGSARFYGQEWPGFSVDAVDLLLGLQVKAIGTDSASVDSPSALAGGAAAHKGILGAGVPVFEALVNLQAVVGRRFTFAGLPLKLEGAEASPVRAVAIFE